MKIKKNYLAYLVRLKSWKKRAKVVEWMLKNKGLSGPFPLYAKIEIDQRCNLSCPKCFRDEVVHNKFLTLEKFNKVLDKLEPGLVEVWTHGFGESSLNPQFLKMMEEVRNRGMLWGLATNGATKFFDADCNILDMMVLKPTKIRFSIDAANPKVFARERFPAKLAKVSKNIRTVVAVRNAMYSEDSKTRPRIDLYCVLTMQTLDQIGPMIKLRDELGCDYLTFSDLAWNNDFGTSVESNAIRQMMSEEEILKLIEPFKDVPRVNFNIPRPKKRTCDYTKFAAYVDAVGDFWFCTCVPGKEPSFGNIFEVENVKELYDSDAANKFRELSISGHISSEECFRCLQWGEDYSEI